MNIIKIYRISFIIPIGALFQFVSKKISRSGTAKPDERFGFFLIPMINDYPFRISVKVKLFRFLTVIQRPE